MKGSGRRQLRDAAEHSRSDPSPRGRTRGSVDDGRIGRAELCYHVVILALGLVVIGVTWTIAGRGEMVDAFWFFFVLMGVPAGIFIAATLPHLFGWRGQAWMPVPERRAWVVALVGCLLSTLTLTLTGGGLDQVAEVDLQRTWIPKMLLMLLLIGLMGVLLGVMVLLGLVHPLLTIGAACLGQQRYLELREGDNPLPQRRMLGVGRSVFLLGFFGWVGGLFWTSGQALEDRDGGDLLGLLHSWLGAGFTLPAGVTWVCAVAAVGGLIACVISNGVNLGGDD